MKSHIKQLRLKYKVKAMSPDNKQQMEILLHENPLDTDTRLVLADWLEEHGDMDVANFQRAVVDFIDDMDKNDPSDIAQLANYLKQENNPKAVDYERTAEQMRMWTVRMGYDGYWEDRHIGPYNQEEAEEEAQEILEEWMQDGAWNEDGEGAEIISYWSLVNYQDEKVATGGYTLVIEPDHDLLIEQAGGDNNCDHEWEDDGSYGHGGTSMSHRSHCRLCGLRRVEHSTGSQRNPGEHDTVSYEQPNSWCAECESEECKYEDRIKVGNFSDDDAETQNALEHGKEINSFEDQEEARSAASHYAHEHGLGKGVDVYLIEDDTEDGDGEYHIFVY